MNPTMSVYTAKFLINLRYLTPAIKILSKFCDLYAHCLPILPLCCEFQIIFLKTVGEVAERRTVLCHVCKAKFLCKSRVCNSSNKKLTRVCDLNAHPLPIFSLCGKFHIIFLKAVEVAET